MSAFVYSANPDDFRIHTPNAQNVGDYVIPIKHVYVVVEPCFGCFFLCGKTSSRACSYNTQPEEEKERT